jgi:hypothetical protein
MHSTQPLDTTPDGRRVRDQRWGIRSTGDALRLIVRVDTDERLLRV